MRRSVPAPDGGRAAGDDAPGMIKRTSLAALAALTIMAPAATAATPLTDHVAGPADLPGATFTAQPHAVGLRAFAREHEKRVRELRRLGYRAAAESAFGVGRQPTMGFSLAIRMTDARAARREARRLFRANSEPEPGTRASALAVPGVEGARGVLLSGRQDGLSLRAVEIVWTSGTVLHELFLFGRRAAVRPPAMVSAAQAVDGRAG